jgi:hypothetical protein
MVNDRLHGEREVDALCGARVRSFEFYANADISNSPQIRAVGRTAFSSLVRMLRDRGNKKTITGTRVGSTM